MIKPDFFLEKYGVVFQKTDSAEEKMRKMIAAFGVHEIYRGNKPYIFVSYAHKDSALVLPAIKMIQEAGYPVWFDAGISPGSEWAADISRHLKNASLVLAFVSDNAFESNNCRAEIVYAFGHRKPMLTVRLDNTPLPDGLDMQLSLSQMFDAFAYDDGDEFVTRLSAAAIIPQYIRPVMLDELAEKRRKAEEAERQRQAEEAARLRRLAEEAERQREVAEKAEQELREAEEAERKYQQAKEDARKRREAEENQQKQWEAEQAAKNNEKMQRDQARRAQKEAEKQAKEAAQTKRSIETQIRDVDANFRQVEFALGVGKSELAYKTAISMFNEKVGNNKSKDPEVKERVLFLREKLCNRLYKDACEMETERENRRLSASVFAALPPGYKDAGQRSSKIIAQSNKKEWASGIFACLLFLGLHIFLSKWFLNNVEAWILKFLVMLAPAVLCSGFCIFGRKTFAVPSCNAIMAVLFMHVVTLIMDACLFQSITFWRRLLWTVVFTVVSALITFIMIGIEVDHNKEHSVPSVQ